MLGKVKPLEAVRRDRSDDRSSVARDGISAMEEKEMGVIIISSVRIEGGQRRAIQISIIVRA
jgi:autonomous glycyl radical cofactor GrcA